MSDTSRIKEIDKEFVKLGLIDALPMIMIGLALHTKFDESREPLFEFLKNESIVNCMLLVSVPVALWVMYKTSKLAKERKAIESN